MDLDLPGSPLRMYQGDGTAVRLHQGDVVQVLVAGEWVEGQVSGDVTHGDMVRVQCGTGAEQDFLPSKVKLTQPAAIANAAGGFLI